MITLSHFHALNPLYNSYPSGYKKNQSLTYCLRFYKRLNIKCYIKHTHLNLMLQYSYIYLMELYMDILFQLRGVHRILASPSSPQSCKVDWAEKKITGSRWHNNVLRQGGGFGLESPSFQYNALNTILQRM